jgi:hypothetical protein
MVNVKNTNLKFEIIIFNVYVYIHRKLVDLNLTFLNLNVSFATLRFIKILRFNKSIIVFFIAFKQSLNE